MRAGSGVEERTGGYYPRNHGFAGFFDPPSERLCTGFVYRKQILIGAVEKPWTCARVRGRQLQSLLS
jgi:hypothetical protein